MLQIHPTLQCRSRRRHGLCCGGVNGRSRGGRGGDEGGGGGGRAGGGRDLGGWRVAAVGRRAEVALELLPHLEKSGDEFL